MTREIIPGMVEFHPNVEFRKEFYDLMEQSRGEIVDRFFMQLVTLLDKYGYSLEIFHGKRQPATKEADWNPRPKRAFATRPIRTGEL